MHRIEWTVREPPLAPRAIVGTGAVAAALSRRLLATADATADLECLADAEFLCAVGEADALPWVDGATYLAPDPDAPALWGPTYLRPTVLPALVVSALAHRGQPRPFAVLPAIGLAFSLSYARPVTPQRLTAWMDRGG